MKNNDIKNTGSSRRGFLKTAALLCLGALAPLSLLHREQKTQPTATPEHEFDPAQLKYHGHLCIPH